MCVTLGHHKCHACKHGLYLVLSVYQKYDLLISIPSWLSQILSSCVLQNIIQFKYYVQQIIYKLIIFVIDINHHVIHSLCVFLLFSLVPVEEYYNNQKHSQHNQPSYNCNDCNSRLHSIGSWLHICGIVSGESCIHNSRLNNQVRIMYTSSQIRLFIAMLWLYMYLQMIQMKDMSGSQTFLSPRQYCQNLKMSNFICVMELLGCTYSEFFVQACT